MYSYSIITIFACIALSSASICGDPQVTSKTYTTVDGTAITNVAYIAELTLKCSSGASDIPLYAEVNGKIIPAVQSGNDAYQVSWTEEISKSRSGTYTIKFYDEEGYAALRKAIRNSEDVNAIPALFSIGLHHPGTYQGPWINSEFLAAVVSFGVFYLAYSAKAKLLL